MTQPLTVCIADWPVTLTFAERGDESRARFAERYAEFLVPPQPSALALDVRVEPGPDFIPVAAGAWQINTRSRNGRIEFESYYESGWAEPAAGRGALTLRPQGDPENFLRVVYAWLCLNQGAVLLHACGVVRNGRGYVFFGPSGSGKTTTARLSLDAGCTVLSDDLVILKKRGQPFWLHGVPFRGDLPEAPRINQSAPAQAVFALVKDSEHGISPMPAGESAARLASCAPFVMSQPSTARRVMEICADLASSVPVRQLRFRRDPGFWRLIDKLD